MWQAVQHLLDEQFGHSEIQEITELAGGDIHSTW